MKRAIHEWLGRFLAIRPRSEREVERYLTRKSQQYELTPEDIGLLLSKYKDAGLINDELFTESLIHSALSKGKGARFIQVKLKTSGVDEALSQGFLARISDTDLKEAMAKRLHKYEKKWVSCDKTEKRRKAVAALFSSGFPGREILPFVDDWLLKE